MASALLTVDELKQSLGETDTDADRDALYAHTIAQVQAVFEAACNRHERPFVGGVDARVEVLDGTGCAECWLPYPVRNVTGVRLGFDRDVPDEILAVADKRVLLWGAGSRRLVRVDGGVFGALDAPRYVEVTYATQDDVPAVAKAAVLAGAKLIINRLGAEGASAERVGAYSIDYASFVTADMANDPIWKLGVEACWEPRT